MKFFSEYFTKDNFKKILHRSIKLLPALIYLVWFKILENLVPANGVYTLMHSSIDDIIPFCEYFIIPYDFWFILMGFTFAYFLLTSDRDFDYVSKFIFGGMLVALFICTIFPNGQNLRPDISQIPDNFFGRLCVKIYSTDTPTNVCPSVHVYNSIAAYLVVKNSEKFSNNKIVKNFYLIMAILISLSTMFLKQHSFVDVVCALALVFVMYNIVYKRVFDGIKLGRRKEKSVVTDK